MKIKQLKMSAMAIEEEAKVNVIIINKYQESNGQNDAPRESEHGDAPVGHAAGPFDEDGHDTFAIVGPTAYNQDGRYLDDVDDHEPPQRAHHVIQVVNDGNPQLNHK
jgi:hypothetical protein